MQSAEGVGSRGARIFTELAVIVVGVLIALAADRWNEARVDRTAEAVYLERFEEEIREDSARAGAYLESRPSIVAGLDSLIAFMDGSPPPENLVATLLFVSNELTLPPVIAWGEIQASNSLRLITDVDVRSALMTYYARRDRILLSWLRQDGRGRDPLWDELYRTGVFDPGAEFGSPSALPVEVLRAWPGVRELLVALGTGHYFQRRNAESVQEAAGVALEILRR